MNQAVGRTDTESGLIRQVQNGDAVAFEELYRRHVGRVYALCLRMTGNQERAEELAQVVFIRVWETIGSFKGESAFTTWLHRVTVNSILESVRAERRRMARVFATDSFDSIEPPSPSMHPGVAMDLEQAITDLPQRARWIFLLHDKEGYQHAEIASLLGIAVGTSKAQLHRARKLLRKVLDS